jgi:hypothetical protein
MKNLLPSLVMLRMLKLMTMRSLIPTLVMLRMLKMMTLNYLVLATQSSVCHMLICFRFCDKKLCDAFGCCFACILSMSVCCVSFLFWY